jgi:hypothetical protein
MALFNESLAPAFNALIRRLHGMKGGAPAPQVSPEISHMIVLENDRPEFGVLKGEYRYATAVSIAAGGAGTFAQIQLTLPAASGVISVIEEAWVINPTGGPFSVRLGGTLGAVVGSSRAPTKDTRGQIPITNAQSSTLFGSSNTRVVIDGAQLDQLTLPASLTDIRFHCLPLILSNAGAPDSARNFTFWQGTAVTALTMAFVIRERPILESEVQFP